MAAPCRHCGDTNRYTDPLLQVRCPRCLNVLNDQAPGSPMGRMQDLEAPMQIGTHTYQQPITSKYS